MWIFKTHSSTITWAIECTACVRHIKPSERLKRSLVSACCVPVYTIILTIFGVVLGVLGLFYITQRVYISYYLLFTVSLCTIHRVSYIA